MLFSETRKMLKILESLKVSYITCLLTRSCDDNIKFFQELRNMLVLKVWISKNKLLLKIDYESFLGDKLFCLLLLYCRKYFWVNDTSFWEFPKLTLGGAYFEQPYREMYVCSLIMCIFTGNENTKNLYFFYFVQVLHVHSYMCKIHISSHIKTLG